MQVKLPAHYATDVYTSEAGYICIAQDEHGPDNIVIIHPDQLEYLILTLQEFMPGGKYYEDDAEGE